MNDKLERLYKLAEQDEYANGGHFDDADSDDTIEQLIEEEGLQDADGVLFINKALKMQAYPNYIQTLAGLENPQMKGYHEETDSFEAFIQPLDNGKYEIKAGMGISLGVTDDLTKAKKIKADFGVRSNESVQETLGDIVEKAEEKAEEYIDGKYGNDAFDRLPIKSQFVIQDYMRTNDINENLFDAIVKNDYKGVVDNYIRENKGEQNQFFKNVFFDGPIGDNDFANLDQAKNISQSFLKSADPESYEEVFGGEEIDNEIDPATAVNVLENSEQDQQEQEASEQQGGEEEMIPQEQGTAAAGGEMPKAEFTGRELVNNREEEMRDAMDKGDNDTAVEIFKEEADNQNNITPGKASHKDNPLPVAQDGTVLDKNGNPTGQVAKKGAGIYDHIDKQYNEDMSNDEILSMIKANHSKWKKNNMG